MNKDETLPRRPRWFNFGNIIEVTLEEQLDLVDQMTGNIPVNESNNTFSEMPVSTKLQYSGRRKFLVGVPRSVICPRKSQHVLFYQAKEASCRDYLNLDVPFIAYMHMDLWSAVKLMP